MARRSFRRPDVGPSARRQLPRWILMLVALAGLLVGWLGEPRSTPHPRLSFQVQPSASGPGLGDLLRRAGKLHLDARHERDLRRLQREDGQAEALLLAQVRRDARILQSSAGSGKLTAETQRALERYRQDSQTLATHRAASSQKVLAVLTPEQRTQFESWPR